MFDLIILAIIYILFLLTDRHTFFKYIYTGLLVSNIYHLIRNKYFFKLKSFILYIFIYFISYYLIKDPNPFYYLLTFYLPVPNFFRAIFIIIFVTYFFNCYILKIQDKKEIKDDVEKKNESEGVKENTEAEEKKEKELQKETEHNNSEGIEKEKKEEKKIEKENEQNIENTKKDNNPKDYDDKKDEDKIQKESDQKMGKVNKDKKICFLSREIKYVWSDKQYLLYLLVLLILLRIAIYFYNIKYWIEFEDKQALLSFNNKNNNTVYYISAVVYNIEPIIKDWIGEMKKLIDYLGTDNVIVSIYENGDSTDKTRKYLNFFENYLINKKVVNRIITEKIEEKEGVDRIRFLAKLRNKSLDFLYQIGDLDFSKTKIIFLNDIIYRYEDIIKLIITNNGDYDSVCGMDYYDSFYDTWASIGLDGKQFRRYFPYMYNKEQQDAYINGETIRTFSCWNGVTVINGKVFEDRNKLFFRTGTKIRQSECTLLHADMYFMGYRKTLVNTQIAVSYTYEYYYKNHYIYPWSKNLITYFYYYFRYGFIKRNYNLTNLVDENIDMDNNLDQVVFEYMIM